MPARPIANAEPSALSATPLAREPNSTGIVISGVIGCFVVLRGMAFIGDAVAHAVFPGLATAFVLGGNLVLGGAVAGVATALLVAIFSQNRRIKEDSIIGILFVGAFALGIVIISRAPGYAGSLQQFLFGSITGIPTSDIYVVGLTGIALISVLLLLRKELVAITLDRETARAMGLPVFWLDLVLYVMVAIAVVVSTQTIGNILVLALLIAPAATARLLTDKLITMMIIAPLVGGLSAMLGLYFSWSLNTPAGGTIVLVATSLFLLAWLGAPKHGLLARLFKRSDEVAEAEDVVDVKSGEDSQPKFSGAQATDSEQREKKQLATDTQKEEVSA